MEEPKTQYVHCSAHSLNLCLQECSAKCSTARDILSFTHEFINLIHTSPKRLALFKKIRAELAPSAPEIKLLCPTRWTVRTASIDAVLKNYGVLGKKKKMETLTEVGSGEQSRKHLAYWQCKRSLGPILVSNFI